VVKMGARRKLIELQDKMTDHLETTKKLLALATKNDDLIEQEDLFRLQEMIINLTLSIATELEKERELPEEFPQYFKEEIKIL